jgi:DNA-binding CsgD family transcriptional regulator
LFAGDLPQAIAHCEDGLAVLPAAAVCARQRARLLALLAIAAGLAGDEERDVACVREVLKLTEAGSEFNRRWYSAWSLWGLGAAAWRQGDFDRATGLHQQSLLLWEGLNQQMGSAWCVEVLAWIVKGHGNKQIAYELGIAEHTVKNHVKNILGKLDVADRTQAATAAIQRGIIHL